MRGLRGLADHVSTMEEEVLIAKLTKIFAKGIILGSLPGWIAVFLFVTNVNNTFLEYLVVLLSSVFVIFSILVYAIRGDIARLAANKQKTRA